MVEDVLRVQNVSWVLRKAIALATVTLTIKHQPDDDGVERIEVVNTLTGGIPGTTELSVLDWTNRSHEDHVFGKILGKSKRVDFPDGIEDPLMKEGWNVSQGEKEDGVLFFYDESVGGNRRWTVQQVRRLRADFGPYVYPTFSPEGLGVWRVEWRAQTSSTRPGDGKG